MAAVRVDLDTVLGSHDTSSPDASRPCYWEAKNHDAKSYLRAEQWLADMKGLTLSRERPGVRSVVPLPYEAGLAIMRYVEEVKMMGNVRDLERAGQGTEENASFPATSNIDPVFLDRHWRDEVEKKWAGSRLRATWLSALKNLEGKLDAAVRRAMSGGSGAFVKLSVRSPKDSIFNISRFYTEAREALIQMAGPSLGPSDPMALSVQVAAIRHAAWRSMCVRSGREALELLLRSERVYIDVLQHELFCKGSKVENFNLNVHVAPFVETFDPQLEFRGFVAGGRRAALTTYSPFAYSAQLIPRKRAALARITSVWDEADKRISGKCRDYSIDFALSPDLKRCWVVEINAFLPPLAGAGLFDMQDPLDAAKVTGKSDTFEFRIREKPLVESDFRSERTDSKTGKVTVTTFHPAPPHVMEYIRLEHAALDASRQNKTKRKEKWVGGGGGVERWQPDGSHEREQPRRVCTKGGCVLV